MREKDIQGKVVGHARRSGVIARKLDFGEGWPDYMFLRDGQILFIEFKRPSENPTALQYHVHKQLEEQGFIVAVVKNTADGMHLIDLFTDEATRGILVSSKETQ